MSILAKKHWFVGLDYHQDSIQVCLMDEDGEVICNRSVANDWRRVVETVPAGGTVTVAIEACSGAACLADELSEKAGWSVSLAHPGYVQRMKQNPDKTDFSDACLLADLLRVGYLPKVWLAPEEIRELRRLVRYRRQLVDERRNVKLRIRALLREHRVRPKEGRPWTKKWLQSLQALAGIGADSQWILLQHLERLQWLSEHIVAAEKRLTEKVQGDAVVEKLLQQPGVGLITAATMRAEIGRFDRFQTGKQLSRFAGVTPRNASSGQRQADAGLIRAGNPHLRAVLIEAAHRLMNFDPSWQGFKRRLREEGKPICVIVAAVANRWMRRLYHQMQPERLAA